MMHSKKIIVPFLCTLVIFPISGFAQDLSPQEIQEELREMKERIECLEDEVRKKNQEIEGLKEWGRRDGSRAQGRILGCEVVRKS